MMRRYLADNKLTSFPGLFQGSSMSSTEHRKSKPKAGENLELLLSRAAEAYKRALIGHQPGLTWDYLVLTAANEHQAAGYRHELAARASGGGPLGAFFPSSQQNLVVPDPPGFRAGSGGATFGVLRAIAAHHKSIGETKPFDALRILLIHSGGASQRLPQYSALGKIFAPLPLIRPDGQLMTLFDHLYLMLAAMPPRLGAGMLIAAGDVFLLFDGAAMPSLPENAGITALSLRTPAEFGEHHGVFKIEKPTARNPKAAKSAFPLVVATMQKATVEQMRSAGVTDERDRVLIDSGLLFFDAAATTALHTLSRKYSPAWHLKTRRQIDLYSDIVPAALTQNLPLLSGDPLLRKLQSDLRHALAHSPLRVYEFENAHFAHLGTTRQFRDAMTGLDPAPINTLFHKNVRFACAAALPKTARVFQSVVSAADVKIAEHVVIENCSLPGRLTIGHGSILSNLKLSGRGAHAGLHVPPDTLVFGVPIEDGNKSYLVTVISGVHDDFKTDRTLCNIDLRHWLSLAGLSESDLWPDDRSAKRSLWTAKLYRGIHASHAGAESHMSDIEWMTSPHALTSAVRKAWRADRRYSMADILERGDAAAMAHHRDMLSGILQATEWLTAVADGSAASVQSTINHFGPAGYQQLTEQVHRAARNPATPPLIRARLFWSLAEIIDRPHFPHDAVALPAAPGALQNQAFSCIRQAMDPRIVATKEDAALSIENSECLIASAPVRIDLAGGWTDTPPYCLENGGTVVNVAINLNDTEPIQSTFRPLNEPIVRLVSRDLGKTRIITDPEQLAISADDSFAGNPFALHMVALRLTGLAPTARETSMHKWLSRLHRSGKRRRGFELMTASNLPKGSGMGTSSILGAATLAVLRAATGQDNAPASLFEQTLLLEQYLGTGGGWQDQVGGILGGAKITSAKPGIPQRLHATRIPLSPAHRQAFEDRLVVYFTGQQRLARNILREVMGRYLSREPGTLVLFNELVHCAHAATAALKNADWLSCSAEINRYWRIKKDLFPGSTTPAIDSLFLQLRPHYLAGGLAGAGGGGFAYFLCATPDQAHRLRTELRNLSMRPGSLGLTFAAHINTTGLRVSKERVEPHRAGRAG